MTYFHTNTKTPTLNVVAVSETSKLFLASCVPNIEFDFPSVGVEAEWVHLHSKCGCKQGFLSDCFTFNSVENFTAIGHTDSAYHLQGWLGVKSKLLT